MLTLGLSSSTLKEEAMKHDKSLPIRMEELLISGRETSVKTGSGSLNSRLRATLARSQISAGILISSRALSVVLKIKQHGLLVR